ncbi:efflux RND transporter periplasmic adaptor subunit [Desulfococcus sp.]|uniref:efflux RND transporter periplasmic adaptor subunit n=1 Tax=Desulfococcus sp. TaxID=2025834 RepID=UPI0035946A0C
MKSTPETSLEATLGIGSRATRSLLTRGFIWAAALLLVLAAGVWIWRLNDKAQAVAYKTLPVTRGPLVVAVTATGNLAATNEVEVGSELSGIVTTVEVDFNDRVTKDQPLARLDDTKFRAAVMKSRAALASARAKLRQAEATRTEKEKLFARYRESRRLTGGKIPSMEVLETGEAARNRAVAEVDAARAAIDEAAAKLVEDEADLAKTVIYSPVDGIVLNRAVDPGQTFAASLQSPILFTLAEDLTRMELQVDVDEADVGQVKEGQQAEFSVDAYPDRAFQARITQVRYGAEDTDGVVTYKAIMAVDNPDLLLRPGMTATADITVERLASALLVPNAALRFTPPQRTETPRRGLIQSLLPRPPHTPRRQAGAEEADARRQRVHILKDGKPAPVAVTTGHTDGTLTAIVDGALEPGQALVVEVLGGKS